MPLFMVWVHRQHADYPDLPCGRRFLKPEIAKDLIAEGCAQSWDTDERKLIPISTQAPKQRAPKPIRKKRGYKRRDLQPEKPDGD